MDTAPPLPQPQRELDAGLNGWRRWWLQRLPRCGELLLTQRTLYILPARAGWMMGLTLLLLLVGSINYQLNLGYLLTFLLTGCAAMSVLVTHQNLRGLRLQWQSCPGVFAGQPLQLPVLLRNSSRWNRHAIALHCLARTSSTAHADETTAWTDVPARDSALVMVPGPLLPRGRWTAPAIHAESRFPLGIFRTWCWWRPAAELWIYPAPEASAPALPLWEPHSQQPDTPAAGQPDTTTPDSVRAYRTGDPLKWLLWKKVAQHPDQPEQWTRRDFAPRPQGPAGELWLDMAQCGLADPEACLSRLCAWVLQADAANMAYGLRLNHTEVPVGHGPAHRQRCLEALACA